MESGTFDRSDSELRTGAVAEAAFWLISESARAVALSFCKKETKD